jgi:hypothetical protein
MTESSNRSDTGCRLPEATLRSKITEDDVTLGGSARVAAGGIQYAHPAAATLVAGFDQGRRWVPWLVVRT